MLIKLKFDTKLRLDYLGFLFPRIPGEDVYKVSTREPIGELLCARVRESWRPVAEPAGELVATLDLPLNPATRNVVNKFIYYSQADTVALMMAFSATFDLDFAGYYRKGESLGYGRKEIVEAFIISRNLVEVDCSDTLYKRVYRTSQRQMKSLTQRLLRRCYYLDESINLKGLKDDTNNQRSSGELGNKRVRPSEDVKAVDDTRIRHAGKQGDCQRERTLFDL